MLFTSGSKLAQGEGGVSGVGTGSIRKEWKNKFQKFVTEKGCFSFAAERDAIDSGRVSGRKPEYWYRAPRASGFVGLPFDATLRADLAHGIVNGVCSSFGPVSA